MLNVILVLLCVAVAAGAFGMVALYNQTVNLNQNITAAKAQLNTIGSENTTLSNQVMATLGASDNVQNIVSQDGLIVDNNPQYLQTNQQWPIASQ